jgi:hypothetical protein
MGDRDFVDKSWANGESEALKEVYGPEFTKETKSEATWAITSVLIYY